MPPVGNVGNTALEPKISAALFFARRCALRPVTFGMAAAPSGLLAAEFGAETAIKDAASARSWSASGTLDASRGSCDDKRPALTGAGVRRTSSNRCGRCDVILLVIRRYVVAPKETKSTDGPFTEQIDHG